MITQNMRRVCRHAERKWLKDKLQMSYDMFRESLQTIKMLFKPLDLHIFRKLYHIIQITRRDCFQP